VHNVVVKWSEVAPGAWVLAERPARDGMRRARRTDVAWWFANLDSVMAIGFAVSVAVVAPTWTRTWSELLLSEAGAVAVVIWALWLADSAPGLIAPLDDRLGQPRR
jgi:hypothetical protein